MSTSAAAENTPTFLKEDEIGLLTSMLENTPYPEFTGNYSERQINNKKNRMKQKYKAATRTGNFDGFRNDLEVLHLSHLLWFDRNEKKNEKEEGMIRSEYPHVMKHVPAGIQAIYKTGLERVGADVVAGLERAWVELELEEATILSNHPRIN